MKVTRYKAFQLPKTQQWGVIDRNTKRYLLGVVAEDEEAARGLAYMLNREFAKWVALLPLAMRGTEAAGAEPTAVIVPYVVRRRHHLYSVADAPLPQQVARQEQPFNLHEYARRAPDSERRLIARLRSLRVVAAAD